MCDLNKIGALIAAASVGVLVAIGLCVAAAIAAGSFWGALGNGVLMGGAAVAIGLALASINVAIGSMGPCVQGRCKGPAEVLHNALIGLAIALTVLLAAVIVGIFAASIPWAGTAVAIGLGVGATAIGITLALSAVQLNALQTCLMAAAPPPPGVTAGLVLATIAVVVLVLLTGGIALNG